MVNITDEPEQKMTVKLVERLGNLMPVSPQDAAGTKERLIMAGYRKRLGVGGVLRDPPAGSASSRSSSRS